jgi:hypothetical protein
MDGWNWGSKTVLCVYPIIFLDVDGVLNGHEFLMESQSCTINPACVARLNRIVKAADARIVLSSAWRYMVHGHAMTLDGFGYMLRTHGFLAWINGSDKVIIDLTCRDEDIPERPDQIRAWLRHNGYKGNDQRYVVIDDDDFGWGDLNVVLTDGARGLTDEDVERAIVILNEPHGDEDTTEFPDSIEVLS